MAVNLLHLLQRYTRGIVALGEKPLVLTNGFLFFWTFDFFEHLNFYFGDHLFL